MNYPELKMIERVENVSMSNLTHTKTGGIVPVMFYPKNLGELKRVVMHMKQLHQRFEILGGMTNIAVASGNLDFIVINMSKYAYAIPKFEEADILKVSASYEMKKLAVFAVDNDIYDLAWMEGIPGTVGAGVYMNAGFLPNEEFGQFLIDVEVLDLDTLEVRTIKNYQLGFTYRYSNLQHQNVVILSVRLLVRQLAKSWKIGLQRTKLKKKMKKYHERRSNNQPLERPSAGTVFVPPFPYHVGWMLRELHLVGYRLGTVEISTKSPGFIVGYGDKVLGEDYYEMVQFIKRVILEKYDIELTPEVRLLGFEDRT